MPIARNFAAKHANKSSVGNSQVSTGKQSHGPRYSFLKKRQKTPQDDKEGSEDEEEKVQEVSYVCRKMKKVTKFSPFVHKHQGLTHADCLNLTVNVEMNQRNKTMTKVMTDRFIPRRDDSIDGAPRNFLQMESSCTDSVN